MHVGSESRFPRGTRLFIALETWASRYLVLHVMCRHKILGAKIRKFRMYDIVVWYSLVACVKVKQLNR